MYILGINAYHGDASACLIHDGKLVTAVEEERFTRSKHSGGFPRNALRHCLKTGNIKLKEIGHVAISRNPNAHIHKKVLFALAHRPNISQLIDRIDNSDKVRGVARELCDALEVSSSELQAKIHHVEHHKSHIASSFLVSPFEKAAVLSIDGFGDFVSTMWGQGKESELEIDGAIYFPHSIGILYTALTQYLGFTNFGEEGKTMGLSAYGKPSYLDKFHQIVKLKKDGKFELDLSYFLHHSDGVEMQWNAKHPSIGTIYSDKLIELLGDARTPQSEITDRHKNIASSLQAILEEITFELLNHLHEITGERNLCLAGGVALNSVMNGKISSKTPFEQVFVQPAASDAGTSLGAAYYVYNTKLKNRRSYSMNSVYVGTEFSNEEIQEVLDQHALTYQVHHDFTALAGKTAKLISEGQIAGWFQGKMEFGPRALGNRSILADPRNPEMRDILNSRIKHRESFRPFAPSILFEAVDRFFENGEATPFMLKVDRVKEDKRASIPAVTHVDGTGRVQTVHRETNPKYWQLLSEFQKLTNIPVLLNTSFNENEPIVNTPREAILCFLRTKMDLLVLGNFLILKEENQLSP